MKKSEVTLGRASLYDLVEMHNLEQRCFPSPWPIEVLHDDICMHNHPYFVLRLDDIAVGYCGMDIVLDEAHIRKICVDEKYRRNGFGKMLMEAMLEQAKADGAKGITLEVRASNRAAIGFYESFGFESAGLRKQYYLDREDALILWKYFS